MGGVTGAVCEVGAGQTELRYLGEVFDVVTNLSHHFLDPFDEFPTVAEMTCNGSTTVVLAQGALAQLDNCSLEH